MSRKRGARGKKNARERVVTVSHPPLRKRRPYRLSGNEEELTQGTPVVTTGAGGLAMGTILTGPHAYSHRPDDSDERPGQLVRVASERDLRAQAEAEARKDHFLRKTLRLIRDRELPLRIVEIFVDGVGGRMTLCVLADEDEEYTSLVDELSRTLSMKIDLRRLGDRDQSRLLGGIGRCGRTQCCSSHLDRYPRVSIKMAKTQGVALAQERTNGNCGRTLCCLNYEQEFYENYHRFLPRVTKRAKTVEGVEGRVMAVDVLRQTFTLRDDQGRREVLPAIFWDQNQGKKLPEPELKQGPLVQQAASRLQVLDAEANTGQNKPATRAPKDALKGPQRNDNARPNKTRRRRSKKRSRSRADQKENK